MNAIVQETNTEKLKKPRYGLDDIIAGAQKRWRIRLNPDTVKAMYANALARKYSKVEANLLDDDGVSTLNQKIEKMINWLRYEHGDTLYIPTASERAYTALYRDAMGLTKTIVTELMKGATPTTLQRVTSQQVAMRKMDTYIAPHFAAAALRYLQYHKYLMPVDQAKICQPDCAWKFKPEFKGLGEATLILIAVNSHQVFAPLAPAVK